MMIPIVFIFNLVEERKTRQREVIEEISSKWATAQTLSGPYLSLPYIETNHTDSTKQAVHNILLLPEQLRVAAGILPEVRKRSIYQVVLYQSNIHQQGHFLVQLPAGIQQGRLLLKQVKICLPITDYRGIQEKVVIDFNGAKYDMLPENATTGFGSKVLAASVPLSAADLTKQLSFNIHLKIKGSEQLRFIPLSANSKFSLHSPWPNPSFTGNTLPAYRQVSSSGYTATWTFNQANLPFGTVLKEVGFDPEAFAFGVSMLQPADHYAKTMRCVKYAILFIGLTFSLFFIIELLQSRPVHPVQYILVGLALVVFYTLLLSFSEYIPFDWAYGIAAFATVSLITLYAKSHFASWKVAGIFAAVLGGLYSFIFVLIRLEDTALLIGSIGLFIVLALAMYASRNINWYQPRPNNMPDLV